MDERLLIKCANTIVADEVVELLHAHGIVLTSSTRTPKFIRKQWRNALMAFHQHSSVDYLLVLRQCNLYGHYSFSKFEHLVHTHIYA